MTMAMENAQAVNVTSFNIGSLLGIRLHGALKPGNPGLRVRGSASCRA